MIFTCDDGHQAIVYEATSYMGGCPLCAALEEPELEVEGLDPVELEEARAEIEQLKQLLRGVSCQG